MTFSQTSTGLRGLRGSRREEIIEKQYTEIRKLESRYRKLYDGSPVMLRTINTDGIILDCNQAYFTNLGYPTKDEVIGHSIFEHTPKESIGAKRESFEEWRRKGTVRNKEVWLQRKDGSTFPALINANNLYDDEGNLIGSNTAVIDLTQIYDARRKEEKANEEIRKAFEMKEEFVRIAAHEIRTPIQAILVYSELAMKGKVKHEVAWGVVLNEARRLKELANSILDVSKIESGNLTYHFQKVWINEIITESVSSVQQSGPYDTQPDGSKGPVIETKNGEDIELSLDKTRMIQALSNILSNSKFTRDGKITIETCALSY